MNIPEFLYHASPDRNIVELQPHNEYPRCSGESDLVFATPHLAVAAMFLAPRGVDVEIGRYDDRCVIFINYTESEYASKDTGGAIYTLPSATFETDFRYGMGEAEYVSKVSIRPISKMIFKTSVEAMRAYGVEWYFIDEVVMKRVRADPANALKLVSQL